MCIFHKSLAPADATENQRCLTGVALAINKDAIDAATQILACCHCLAMPAMQMLVAAICDKLISWNQATAEALLPGYCGSAGGRGDVCTMAEWMIRQAVRVGDFVLDDALADQAVRSVVLRQLQQIEALVDRFATYAASHGRLLARLQRRLYAARRAAVIGS
jgi:hypothetical protein